MKTPRPIPEESATSSLVGHRFPGGSYQAEHWENFLLTECTGADLLPDGIVHPVALFHMPIIGAGTSIAEMFALGQNRHRRLPGRAGGNGWRPTACKARPSIAAGKNWWAWATTGTDEINRTG
jgi:hypothetical protein